jgi:carbon storage regulator
MLILSRRVDERIMIGEEIEISVVDIKGDQVKIGISAPRNIKVYRKEVFQAIQQENIEAVKTRPSALPHLDGVLGQGDRAKAGKEAAGGAQEPPKDPRGEHRV